MGSRLDGATIAVESPFPASEAAKPQSGRDKERPSTTIHALCVLKREPQERVAGEVGIPVKQAAMQQGSSMRSTYMGVL